MFKSRLSKPIFEKLLMHIVNIENDKDDLTNEYFPEQTKQRQRFKDLLENYIGKIDALIRNHMSVCENADNKLPFVIVGCTIKILDRDTKDVHHYRIVTPDNSTEENDVSIFSPLGKSLLLKEVGDEVIINSPDGPLRYKILSICLAN